MAHISELVSVECSLDSAIVEIGNFSIFKEEYELLRKAQEAFQKKALKEYPQIKWSFGQ